MITQFKSRLKDNYSDGSIDVDCVKCGKTEHLSADHKATIRIKQITDAYKDYICLNCWKENKDKEREAERGQTKEDIWRGESWKLAVEVLNPFMRQVNRLVDKGFTEEEAKIFIEDWQKYFYEKLTNGRNNKIKQNGLE